MHSIPWPQRPLLFTTLGGLGGLAVFFLIDDLMPQHADFKLRVALATAMTIFCLVFSITTRRDRLGSGVLFAGLAAAIIAGISYWRLYIDWPHQFNFMALAVALFVFSPFYQTSLHSSWQNYRALHHHAWSNAVIVPLGLMFVGLTFGMAYLLAELFSLVGIDLFKKLLRRDITPWILFGTALGASIGVLREHEGIIASTQRLVQSVFSLLTSPLALGLSGFILVLPFTGLDSLWSNTRNTSATLFMCALAALVFLNTVVREDTDNQSNNRFMQIAARLLAICLAPLALITSLAVKLRVDQYGWTPDRMWATVICCLLVAYGALYLLATLRGQRFNEAIRQANLYLALLVCAVALILATPLYDFGAHSVKDQLARLKDGRVSEEKFDVIAMAFDFGPAGREALQNLKKTASADFSESIDTILATETRGAAIYLEDMMGPDIGEKITIVNGSAEIPDELLTEIKNSRACQHSYCYLYWSENKTEVILVDQICPTSSDVCHPDVQLYRSRDNHWQRSYQNNNLFQEFAAMHLSDESDYSTTFIEQLDAAANKGKIELRPVQRMQVFIDGTPIGPTMH